MPDIPRPLAVLTGLGLVAGSLVTLTTFAPAQAASTTLVINEVYGGGGSAGAVRQRDFVELRNVGDSPVDLQGMSLQSRAAGATGVATTVFPLPPAQLGPDETFLVAGAAGTAGAALPTPDATSGLSFLVNTGQVWLADTTEPIDPNTRAGFAGAAAGPGIVDFFGWGLPATSFEGQQGPGTGTTTSAQRKTDVDADNNMSDFSLLTPTPAACGCTEAPQSGASVSIAQIQGTGVTSPLLYDSVTTTGRVTGVYPAGGLNGFFLQSGDATGNASDALFVSAGTSLGNGRYPALDASVAVTGVVREVNGMTTLVIDAPADIVAAPTTVPAVTPLDVSAWAELQDPADRERHEGELLDVDGVNFTVTDLARSHRYAEIGLAQGTEALREPVEAGVTPAANARRSIRLDDGATTDYAPNSRLLSQSTPLPWITKAQPARIGSSAAFQQPVILDHRVNGWRFQPRERVLGTAGSAVVTFTGSRPAAPAAAPAGRVRLATFDVGNWFTTTGPEYVAGGAAGTRTCSYIRDRLGVATMNTCSPAGPRGAADATSRSRQRQKLAAAINGLGAAVVGLQGLENANKFGANRDAALADLVAGLNAAAGSPAWDYVASPTVPAGTDSQVVRTGFIYRTAIVRPVGPSVIMSDPSGAFDTAVEPLAQRFARVFALDDDAVTVIVNQFTARNAGTDDGTGQDLGNAERVAQAEALADFAADQAGLANRVFLLGNFNTYANEDPLGELGAFDRVAGTNQPTYVAAGQSGSLDHVLANNAAEAIVAGGDVWDINRESLAFQYARSNAYVTNLVEPATPFASSDHNPVLVDLDLPIPPVADSTLNATASSAAIRAGSGRKTIQVTIASTPQATGSVRAYVGSTEVGQATLSGGAASLSVGPFSTAGNRTIRVAYPGGPGVGASSKNVVVRVIKARPSMTLRKAPAKVFAQKTKAKVVTTLRATGLTATGKLTVTFKGKRLARGTLRNGKVTLTLPKFKKPGRAAVMVTYGGNAGLEKVSKKLVIKVKPKR
jgi:predicted extracellular nuclease